MAKMVVIYAYVCDAKNFKHDTYGLIWIYRLVCQPS